MNIDDYIPVLQWDQKTIEVAKYSLYLTVPCVFYYRDGYPENKKEEESSKIISNWIDMGGSVLHLRARKVAISKIIQDYKKLSGITFTYWSEDSVTRDWEVWLFSGDQIKIFATVNIPRKYYDEISVFQYYLSNQYSKLVKPSSLL